VELLVFGWGEHAEGAVAASGVVEELDVVVAGGGELDVVMAGGGELDAGLPCLALSSSTCRRPQKALTMALMLLYQERKSFGVLEVGGEQGGSLDPRPR